MKVQKSIQDDRYGHQNDWNDKKLIDSIIKEVQKLRNTNES